MAFAEMERLGVAESLGGMDSLGSLIEKVPVAANAEYYARIVHEKAILRSLVAACSEVVQSVYESEAPAREQLDTAEQKVLDIGERGLGRDFVQISEVIDAHFEKIG